ncbi:MAG TPA: prolyl oligopeptidase family serine peptidase, partial [Thermoanaerobaculia bacterium]|nr:prolyl oligopeptidase family serine peptidase [Thermoanaerobaculia bacterium]
MRHCFSTLLCLTLAAPALAAGPIQYPETKRIEQTDTYHGVAVPDPYRWLETDVRQSPEVRKWVEEQNKVTFGYLKSIPEREAIEKRLTELWSYERRSLPDKAGNYYFFTGNDGQQELSVLYVQSSPFDEPRVLIDPHGWSKDGTVNLAGAFPSRDGRYLAYGVSDGGSDWRTFRVLEVATGKLLSDEIRWAKFTRASWDGKGEGFFYTRYPEPVQGAEYQAALQAPKLYYHRLGTPQSEDRFVFDAPENPSGLLFSTTTEDGRYLLVAVTKAGRPAENYIKDLSEPDGKVRLLVPDLGIQHFTPAGNDGSTLYFSTDYKAPNGRVVAVDADDPALEKWKEVIPEAEHAFREANIVGNLLVVQYLRDVVPYVRVFTLAGKHVRDIELPGVGAARGFSGERYGTEIFYTYGSMNRPSSNYRYDLVSGETTMIFQPKLAFEPEDFEVKEVFYKSKDGTRVPLFIAHRKGLALDGSNPTILYGYGGFSVSMSPTFSPFMQAWMEKGGVVAMACLRGGAEYGEKWHEAGTKLKKQNVFDDFIAGAEWLIANRYTRPDKLAIRGGSNGGLLVGAAMAQRPELFGAALPHAGVLDMLRYHLFTGGSHWANDYGTVDDPEEFKALRAYSPYHNLKDGTKYPPTLVMAADTDDRVVPGHSF